MYNIYRGVVSRHVVGKIRTLDYLFFSSWFLKDFGPVVVTRSAGRELHGMTTRFEKKIINVYRCWVRRGGWKAGRGGDGGASNCWTCQF